MSDTVTRAPLRSQQLWIGHVQQWRHSGLSRVAYCEKHNIKRGSFYKGCAEAKLNQSIVKHRSAS